jgi:single-strand DNA-binding protein
MDGLTRVTARPYEFAACDQDTRSTRVCGYTAATRDGQLRKGLSCPHCEQATRPVRRRDGGHVLVCERHGWLLADEQWAFVRSPACPVCGNAMIHREHRELKGQFVWMCPGDGGVVSSNIFGAIGHETRGLESPTEEQGTTMQEGKHMALNRHEIIGRLGRDPELKVAGENGRAWTRLSIATTESWKDGEGQRREHTEWHAAICWGARAEVAVKYLRKGSRIYVSGPVRSREYPDASTGEIRRSKWIQVQDLVFLDDRRKEGPVELGSPPAEEAPAPDVADAGAEGDEGDQVEAA